MRSPIERFLRLKLPLPSEISRSRANCFNAVQLYWKDAKDPAFTGPEEFISYMEANFRQFLGDEKTILPGVTIVWSRSSTALPVGQIKTEVLKRREQGYPFGLLIEHAFVVVDRQTVFQKRDPTENGPYELISLKEALQPYQDAVGFETTQHQRRASR